MIFQVDSTFVGVEVPSDWERYRGESAAKMPDAKRYHFLVRAVQDYPNKATLDRLAQLTPESPATAAMECRHDCDRWAGSLKQQTSEQARLLAGQVGQLEKELSDYYDSVREQRPPPPEEAKKRLEQWRARAAELQGDDNVQLGLLISEVNRWIKFDAGELRPEAIEVAGYPAKRVDLVAKEPYTFVFVDLNGRWIGFEFHDFYAGDVLDQVEPILKSVQIDINREDVQGKGLAGLVAKLKPDRAARKELFFLFLYVLGAVLPATLATLGTRRVALLQGEFDQDCRQAIIGANTRAGGCMAFAFLALGAAGLVTVVSNGGAGAWLIILLGIPFGLFLAAVWYGICLGAGFVASLAAERTYRHSAAVCALSAAGGAFLGGLLVVAFLYMM